MVIESEDYAIQKKSEPSSNPAAATILRTFLRPTGPATALRAMVFPVK